MTRPFSAPANPPAPCAALAVPTGSAKTVRKPYACAICEAKIGIASRYYDEGVCYRCIRLDSRGGAYREYSRKKHRGLHAHRGSDGKTTHLG